MARPASSGRPPWTAAQNVVRMRTLKVLGVRRVGHTLPYASGIRNPGVGHRINYVKDVQQFRANFKPKFSTAL